MSNRTNRPQVNSPRRPTGRTSQRSLPTSSGSATAAPPTRNHLDAFRSRGIIVELPPPSFVPIPVFSILTNVKEEEDDDGYEVAQNRNLPGTSAAAINRRTPSTSPEAQNRTIQPDRRAEPPIPLLHFGGGIQTPADARKVEQEFIDRARATYKMAKKAYKECLQKYRGIPRERADRGRRFRGGLHLANHGRVQRRGMRPFFGVPSPSPEANATAGGLSPDRDISDVPEDEPMPPAPTETARRRSARLQRTSPATEERIRTILNYYTR